MFHFLCTFRRRGILLNTSFESLEIIFFKNKKNFSSEYSEGLYHNLKSEQGEKTSENVPKNDPKLKNLQNLRKWWFWEPLMHFMGSKIFLLASTESQLSNDGLKILLRRLNVKKSQFQKNSQKCFFVVFCEQIAFEFPLFLVTVSFVPITHKRFCFVFMKCYLSNIESLCSSIHLCLFLMIINLIHFFVDVPNCCFENQTISTEIFHGGHTLAL